MKALATLMTGALPVARWGDAGLQQACGQEGRLANACSLRRFARALEPATHAPATTITAGKITGTKVGVLYAEQSRLMLVPARLTPAPGSFMIMGSSDQIATVSAHDHGVALRLFSQIGYGGAACATVHQVAMAIATGAASVVVCYPGAERALRPRLGQVAADAVAVPTTSGVGNGWHYPMGIARPAATVAIDARRYMHCFCATSENFGGVTAADRRHAATNPRAWFYQRPVMLAGHQASRWIVEPLRLLDRCQESDGVVVTSLDRASSAGPTSTA